MDTPKIGMVVGVSGVTGTPLAEQLIMAGWKVYGVSRRVPQLRYPEQNNFHHLSIDLTDTEQTRAAFSACSDVTHVFHCANDAQPEVRLKMISNTLSAIEAMAPRFTNFNLLQGTKYYGSYLGPFKTPAKESDPRIPGGDFYYSEEDLIVEQQAGKRWTWTGVRPTAVCGYAPGNPVNLATVLAIYGSLLRELGKPFGFPSTAACFNALHQVIDAQLLARAAIWVSTTHDCGNQAFNVSNGDMFRWKHMWPALASFFNLDSSGPQPYSLKKFLSDKQPLWDEMVGKYSLKSFPFMRTPDWAQGSFFPPNSRLACEYDFITDTVKVRQSGFNDVIDSEQMFLRMFAQLRDENIIP